MLGKLPRFLMEDATQKHKKKYYFILSISTPLFFKQSYSYSNFTEIPLLNLKKI